MWDVEVRKGDKEDIASAVSHPERYLQRMFAVDVIFMTYNVAWGVENQSLTHSLTRSLSLTHSPILFYSLTHLLTLLTYLLTYYLPIYLLTHSLIYLPIYILPHSFTHSPTYQLTDFSN